MSEEVLPLPELMPEADQLAFDREQVAIWVWRNCNGNSGYMLKRLLGLNGAEARALLATFDEMAKPREPVVCGCFACVAPNGTQRHQMRDQDGATGSDGEFVDIMARSDSDGGFGREARNRHVDRERESSLRVLTRRRRFARKVADADSGQLADVVVVQMDHEP